MPPKKKTASKKKAITKVHAHPLPPKRKYTMSQEMHRKHFRVAIFGSARVKKNDPIYKYVYQLAREVGIRNFDVVTGGGPGLMEAANAGHKEGIKVKKDLKEAHSIGLTIYLPWETKESQNKHLDVKKHFDKFSDRLDTFMFLSNVAVIMPGGVGTCLEFFYTWQLTQVKHICPIPIILLGDMWPDLIKWIKKHPLKTGLISPEDMNNVFVAKNNKEAMKIIDNTFKVYLKEGNDYCMNYKKYKLNK